MRPRIAVNCDVEERGRQRLGLPLDYLDALYEAGADPLILPPDPRALPLLAEADGVLLTGGDDYAASLSDPARPPPRYESIHPRRERFDLLLGRAVLDADLPVLAICAGYQLLALLGGGRIIEDIPTAIGGAVRHRRANPDEERPRHPVRWSDPGLAGLPEGSETVVSHHHQGVGALPGGWRPWAVAEDGVIEGAIGPGRFQVGVQWHPELSPREPAGRRLFRALVEAALTAPRR
jgi:putative glutamine amidotransferase